MGYSGYSTTRPRSILVITGGMLAWMGLVGGVLITTPEYHRALTMKAEPVEMTWQELVDNGLSDNAHVRLIDVALAEEMPASFRNQALAQITPVALNAGLEDASDHSQDESAEIQSLQQIDEMFDLESWAEFQPTLIKVYPKDQRPADVPAKVMVPMLPGAVESAFAEVESSQTLTGRFTLSGGEEFEKKLTDALLAGQPGRQPDAVAETEPSYVYEPTDQIPTLSEARQWFWLSFLAVAVGLVICGSGGPSIACCVFFQGPSLLSVFGYPLRYGRAGKLTRVVYALIGMGLLGYAYQKMFVEGQFGQLDGNIALAVIGYLASSVGAAAILGSMTSVVAERLNISLEPTATKQVVPAKMTYEQACAMTPVEGEETTQYIERQLITADHVSLGEPFQQIADSLGRIGFSDPQPVAWQNDTESVPTLVQLGCQEMVLAHVDHNDGQTHAQLVSVLQDGVAVITLSGNTPGQAKLRFGSNGLYSISDSNDPAEMLSSHLEQTINMAEKRKTAVVTLDPIESADVILFARRVLADIRAQYGEELIEVGDAAYGRFRFPVRPLDQS